MDSSELIGLAKKFLCIESTNDKPDQLKLAVDFIYNVLQNTPGISVERFESNGKPSLLAYFGKQRPKRFKVLMNGHVDVVPAEPDQFKPYVKGGKLYGRGAGDMKTTALIMTRIFCDLAPKLNYPLGLQIVADEEVGGHDGTKYQLDQGVESDFVIIGECSAAGTLSPEARGICWADVHFNGRPAHGAYPWRGDNAALKAVQFIEELGKIYPVPAQEEWITTANVASIRTDNLANNRVPSQAKVSLDLRYVLGDSNFASRQSAQQFLENLLPGAKPEIVLFEPAYAIDRQNPILRKLLRAIQTDIGRPVEFVRRYGSSDARFYGANGTPVVAFGLPDHNIHADNEYIEAGWIPRYQRVLTSFLKSL
jgi:succinyl-diaminopimelate desuccinylase